MQQLIAEARSSIRQMLRTEGLAQDERQSLAQESEWLRVIYGRFRSDSQSNNDRVYASSRLYIPLSLAPLAALVAGVDDPTLSHVLLLGAVSSGLMLLNVATADRERQSRRRYVAWMVAIQDEIGLDTDSISRDIRGFGLATLARVAFVVLVIAWTIAGIAVQLDWL